MSKFTVISIKPSNSMPGFFRVKLAYKKTDTTAVICSTYLHESAEPGENLELVPKSIDRVISEDSEGRKFSWLELVTQ